MHTVNIPPCIKARRVLTKLHNPLLVQKQVVRPDIPVGDSDLVEIAQRREGLT